MSAESVVKPCTTEAELDALLQQSQDRLVVIDVHPAWSGPCETLVPTINRMLLSYENSEERLAFVSCDETLHEKLQTLSSSDAKFTLEGLGCAPLLLVVRFGKAVGKIDGANAPALVALVDQQIPPVPEAE
ncbi:hypothetical protein ScalyP_jg8967 [Parmales sp. scaly parma]|nr:hypothetical protein ScalyP_jg8967 [Parmales sp. scaly parma]